MKLSRGDRTLLGSGAVVLALLLTVTIVLLKPSSGDQNPSSYATGSGGAKAAYLLLEALGYRVARWEQPPEALADPTHTTLVLAEPAALPTAGERQALHRFIEQGGRVIATGILGAICLSGSADPDPVSRLTWKPALAAAPSVMTRAAPVVTLAPQASWNPQTFALPMYVYGEERVPVVVTVPIAGGEAYWWAAATPLSNAGLGQPGNLEFFLASIGPPGERRVLFDEYFHGDRPTLAGSILQSPVKWVVLQLGVLLAAVLWTYARRSGPIMPPAPDSRLSPLEFVRTLGSLYERAGAASVAVDIAYRRFRFWVGRRLGVPSDLPIDLLEQAVLGRWAREADPVVATLRACETAREDAALGPRTALSLIRSLGEHAARLGLFRVSQKEKP